MWGRGTVLGGRYTLTERIGGGGMGDVWRADDGVLARQVAVKVLHPALLDDELFAERFRREARLMAALSHPGIVDVYDYGEGEPGSADQRAYIVMEFIDGQPLSEVLAAEGAMPPSRALALVAQTLDALHAAHQRDIVHRDLKPSNLMLRSGDQVTVTDFGIARSAASTTITASHAVLGTALYMAPEQAEGGATTPLSDLYSAGVLCYELLTGQVPFTGETVLEVVLKHIREPAPQLPGLFPQVVRDFIATAMAKRPEDRYPDAAAMAAAARAALRGGPATLPATAAAPVVQPVTEPVVPPGTEEPKTIVIERRPQRSWRRALVPLIIPVIITTGAGTALLIDRSPGRSEAAGAGPSLSRSEMPKSVEPSPSSPTPSAVQTPAPEVGTPTAPDPNTGSAPGGTVPKTGGQVSVPGGTTTVPVPVPKPPAATHASVPPAPAPAPVTTPPAPATTPPSSVDTVPAGCGGAGWGHITSVGSGRRLGLPSSAIEEGTAVVTGGYSGYGWVRVRSGNLSEFHPCSQSKPAMGLALGTYTVQLSSEMGTVPGLYVEPAGTAGAVHLGNSIGMGCLTDNGAGRRITLEECKPGNKSQEWYVP
ncbi:hypothetical protein KCMC57_up56360 [Kitasatospora sp. CMC57]|uniref:non-specific serine/threonine protein kinase n=1 Tax=Kitasatospora sp. CMC57 TaxID=3231513 RepID=A0AB33KCZ1_9ACTN